MTGSLFITQEGEVKGPTCLSFPALVLYGDTKKKKEKAHFIRLFTDTFLGEQGGVHHREETRIRPITDWN